jgi:cytochrome c peroxidase
VTRSRLRRALTGVGVGFGFLSLTACTGDAGKPAAAPPDTTEAAFANLSPAVLPAPPQDVSNRWADDPAAARFGQIIFFDPGFAGALLDPDNVGDPSTLGVVGETGKVACAGCHLPEAGFVDVRSPRKTTSLGAGWGRRRAKPLLDVGQAKLLMWDGLHDALYNQPFTPFESATEINSSRLYVAERVHAEYRPAYQAIFGAIPAPLNDPTRFPQLTAAQTGCRKLITTPDGNETTGSDCHGMPGDQAEYDGLAEGDKEIVTRVVVNVGKALGAYERLLGCGPGRFDAYVHGDKTALSDAEVRGAALFVGKAQCTQCHSGPFFSDQQFHNVGLSPGGVGAAGRTYDTGDHGAAAGLKALLGDPLNVKGIYSDGDDDRLPAAISAKMDGAFRTQSLRCVSTRPSFMHTGHLHAIADVVALFARGGDTTGFEGQSENFKRPLSSDEQADIVAFLSSLDGPGPAVELLKRPPLYVPNL